MATDAVDSIRHAFSDREIEEFWNTGFVVVRQLADRQWCRDLRAVTREELRRGEPPVEYEADLQYPGAPESRQAAGGQTVRRLKQAHARHVLFSKWLLLPELTTRLRQLLGPEVVIPLAHHNCIMTKHPQFSSETGWHQDIRYWSFQRPELISIWLALGTEGPQNGGLKLLPGTHRLRIGSHQLDEAKFLRPELPENHELIGRGHNVVLQEGDVLFFHCRTFHAADRNQSSETKFSVVFSARPGDNPPIPGTRSASMPEMLLPPEQ